MSTYTPNPDTITDTDLQLLTTVLPTLKLGSTASPATVDIGTLYTIYGILNQMELTAVARGDEAGAQTLAELALRVRGHIDVAGTPSTLGPEVAFTGTDSLRLQALANQVGGKAAVNALPLDTLATALNHGDDVIGVTVARMAFDLPDLDVSAGYAVYDSEDDQLYTLDSSTGLMGATWGTQPQDVAWYLNTVFGDYGWLHYRTTAGTNRVLMLLRA